ncbi:MAG: hypothetical protein D6742_07745 [Cyanobacteria bacterium J069]|nr:MAG: hypothetical protein D6742_07745 [Cyanobacteria bacterium J069]
MNDPLVSNLWDSLRAAQKYPEQAEIGALLQQADQAIARCSEAEQLQVASNALLQVAEVCARRAEILIQDWEDAYRDPVVQPGFFAGIVRQTMAVDFSDLLEPSPPRKERTRRAKPAQPDEGSIVGTVDKTALLAMLDQLETEAAQAAQKQQVLAIAHDEDVKSWVRAIALWAAEHQISEVSLQQLQAAVKMPLVQLWLSLLLGNFAIEQRGEFYDTEQVWLLLES